MWISEAKKWYLKLAGDKSTQLFGISAKDNKIDVPKKLWGVHWWLSGKESTCQRRRCKFHPWLGKVPWRRK